METNTDRKIYRVDVGRFVFGFAVRTSVVFVVLWFFERPIRLWIYRLYANLHAYANDSILKFVSNESTSALLIPAVVAGFLWAFFCVKTVIVERGEVRIKRMIGHGRIFPLTDYTFDSYIKLGSRIFKWGKRYLKIEDHDDSVKKIYLPFFGTGTYSALVSAIRAEDTELIPQEIRSEIAYENLVGEDSYYLVPKAKILRAERKRFGIFAALCIGGFALLIVLVISGAVQLGWYYMMLLIVFGIMVLSIPVELFRMLANMRRCPERFKKSGNFLFVDEKGFSLVRIEQITFTDAKAVSYSIYPKYRYMRIKTEDGIYKYCLGSAFSMPYQNYVNLCRGIEELFINDAMKIVYKQK